MWDRPGASSPRPEGGHRAYRLEGRGRAGPRTWLRGIPLVVLGAALAAVGAMLPWVTLEFSVEAATVKESITGLTAGVDGGVTLTAALVAVVLAAAGWWLGRTRAVRRTLFTLALLPSLAVAIVGVLDALTVADRADEFRRLLTGAVREGTEFTFHASVGIGLWMTILAGVVMSVGSAFLVAGPGGRGKPSPTFRQPDWGRTGG